MDFSVSSIVQRIKNALTNPTSKIEGSFAMDNVQAVSQEIARIHHEKIEPIKDAVLLDTATGEDLDNCGLDLLETRHPETYATGTVTFTGKSGASVPIGTLIHSQQLSFETSSAGIFDENGFCSVSAICLTGGAEGNIGENKILTIRPSLADVYSVAASSAFIDGFDAETDDSLRARLLQKRQRPFFSGNKNEYEILALQVSGVGYAHCIPCWAGVWTVKLVLLTTAGEAPSEDLINKVREHIEEYRPPCAELTIVSAIPLPIAVSMDISLESGHSPDEVKNAIQTAFKSYLLAMNLNNKKTLSFYRLGDIVFDVPGVSDITNFTLNGGLESVHAGDEEYLYLQEVIVNEA